MQDSLEYLRTQPSRSPLSPASRRQRNTTVTANSTPGQDTDDPMRVSISAPHGVTTTFMSPETMDTEFNAFQDQIGDLFSTNGIPDGLNNGQAEFGTLMASSADPIADGSLGHTLGLGAVLGDGSMLSQSAFDELDRLVIVRAYIKDQSRIVTQAEYLELDKHPKEAQSQAFDRMLQESDKVCTLDQYRWVYSHIMSALENVDHFEPRQIESAFEKIISAREFAGDSEVSPRLRKLICTRYPHWGTEEQKVAVLISRGLENSAGLSSSQSEEYFPLLHQVIEYGSPAIWNLFRRIGQHPSRLKTDHLGQNLVHAAAAKGDVDLLKILSDLPMHIDARDRYGRTPAFIAASLGQENALEFLHRNGADLSSRTYEATTILDTAATGNHVGIIWKLKELGYDFAEKAMRRESPLTIAAQNGCHEAVYALLRCGADPAFRRHLDQKTAQEVASSMDFPAIAEFLSLWRCQDSFRASTIHRVVSVIILIPT
ncbi:MAG: hypothetical protein Q9172_006077 [Xanthocarpia lactea]